MQLGGGNGGAGTRMLARAGSPALTHKEAAAAEAVRAWYAAHPTTWVAFSGGKDSTVALHLACRAVGPQRVQAVHFDSGMEYPQTVAYIRQVCAQWGVPLDTIHATPGAVEVLRDTGEWEHGVVKVPGDELSRALIVRPLATATARYGNHLIYGLRAQESAGRAIAIRKAGDGTVTKHEGRAADGVVRNKYLVPLAEWHDDDVYAYAHKHHIALNPLYGAMAALGVPQHRRRVGLAFSAHGITLGAWKQVHQLAPALCYGVEQELPLLRQFR